MTFFLMKMSNKSFDKQHQHHGKHPETQNKDIMIYTIKTKMAIKMRMILNKLSHFTKKENSPGWNSEPQQQELGQQVIVQLLYCGKHLVKNVIFLVIFTVSSPDFHCCHMVCTVYCLSSVVLTVVGTVCGTSSVFDMFHASKCSVSRKILL